MSAQPNDADSRAVEPGQWRPTDSHRQRTTKQHKRDLRKDRSRRRRIRERAACDPTLTHTAVRVLEVLMTHSDDSAKPVTPKMITIAIEMQIAKRSARRCVAELETAGYLLRYMRPIAAAMNDSNQYYFRQPAGPIVESRPNQRRKLRIRSPHWGTPKTAGTPKGLTPPSPAGEAKPDHPPRRPAWRRDLPPSATAPAQPKPFPPAPLHTPPPITPTNAAGLREARAALDALKPNTERP